MFTADDGVTPDFPNRLSSSTTPIDSVFFTHGSVLTKLQQLKKSQSPNPDSFPSVVLRNFAHQLATPLSIVYNVIFDLSVLPPDWQKSIVIPLHKKGRHNNPSNYRPISLTSTCCKVMESIIHDFISNYLLTNNLITKHQHGFIKNRSTLTCLLCSLKNWLSSLDLAKSTHAIYIDFAKAFDTVTHEKLLHKLTSYGIHGKLHLWISARLSNQTQSVCIEGLLSPPKSVLTGVLQGSVLQPSVISTVYKRSHWHLFDLRQESRCDIRQWTGNGPACKQHHSKLFLSSQTAEIHPTITFHGCHKNTGSFFHIKSSRLLQQHFLRCHKHFCETTSICPQPGCQVDLEQEEVRPYHSCVEGPTPLASHSSSDRIQDRCLCSQRRTWSRSDLPRLHLQSCPGGWRQISSAVCCTGRPDCASNQDPSLRAQEFPCLRTGCLELTARGHQNSGTVAGTFQIYVENTFVSSSICLAALTALSWLG